jgi:hypothetical protein
LPEAAIGPGWWLGGGESCGFCLLDYSYEVEFRCDDCDRPVCPECVVVVSERAVIICPECRAEGEGG